ncbi:MAG: hypothetical protein Q4E72_04825 [bacterium]|nr:hypothetical protein [bacterium]
MLQAVRRLLALFLILTVCCAAALSDTPPTFSEADILAEESGMLDPSLYATQGASNADGLGDMVAGEESADSIYEVAPGEYEWYLDPAVPLEGHAYVDIYPLQSPVFPEADGVSSTGRAWHYAFALDNTTGMDFTPSFINIIPFWDNGSAYATAREQWSTYFSEELIALLGTDTIRAGTTSVFRATSTDGNLCAIAISMTGKDETGMEIEFHSMVILSPEAAE